jgi:uncharacterized surface protein with fasciclin (FAS1) repeats
VPTVVERTQRLFVCVLAASVLAIGAVSAGAVSAGATAIPAPAARPTADKNIVQTAVAAGQFKTLVMLAKRARLAGALTGERKLTLFAPTDTAFRKVPKATLSKLLRNRAQLRRVLLYHVVAGDVKAAQVVQLPRVKTLAGPSVRIQVRSGSVFLSRSSKVVKTDVAASNGTIHVVNRVLLPPAS